jgi:tRNA threonylcarbamoyl adenosine modification protein (Sua5/YciO/YrdC/YwlC family)
LAEKFWPGPLTLIFHAQPSLTWDLGDTFGTVALRIPDDEIAHSLLTITGPLAVSSANRTGHAAAQTAGEALEQLSESVEVYLDDGVRPAQGAGTPGAGGIPSTIVDCTGERLRVVREGGVTLDALRDVVPDILGLGEEAEGAVSGAEEAEATGAPADEAKAAVGEAETGSREPGATPAEKPRD